MSEIAQQSLQSNGWTDRADELFQQHRQEIYRNTDQLFARLMLFQWVASIIIAMIISPRTWVDQSSYIHIHIWAAIFMGGAITVFPIWMTRAWPGTAPTRHIIAVGQMLMSVLLIDLTGGRIETHFHVFGSLVILSFYRDWRVLISATIVVYLDHFLRGIYWPYSVYGVLSAGQRGKALRSEGRRDNLGHPDCMPNARRKRQAAPLPGYGRGHHAAQERCGGT